MSTNEDHFGAGCRIIPAALAVSRLLAVADLLDDLRCRFDPGRVMPDGLHAVTLAVDLLGTVADMVAGERMALGRCPDCDAVHIWASLPEGSAT